MDRSLFEKSTNKLSDRYLKQDVSARFDDTPDENAGYKRNTK